MTIFTLLFLYIALLIGVSWWSSRKSSDEDFLIAGRSRGTGAILFSKYASSVGLGWFMVYTGYIYQFGPSASLLLPGLVFSFILFAFWAVPRIRASSGTCYTKGEYVEACTKSTTARHLTDLLSIAIAVLTILIALIGGAKIISTVGPLSYEWALLGTAGVVLSYVLLSGFRAVILTDILQSGIMLVLLILVAWYAVADSTLTEFASIPSVVNVGELFGFFVFGLLSVFAASDRYQLTFAAKNNSVAKRGMFWALAPVLLTFILLMFVGLSVALRISGLDSDLVLLYFIENSLTVSLLPLAIVLLCAGLMSTADTYIYVIGLYLARLRSKWRSVFHVRVAITLVVVILTGIALLARNMVDVAILSGALMLPLAIAMIYIIAGGTQAYKFIGAMVGGLIGVVFGISLLGLSPAAAPFPIIGALLGLLWPARWTNAPKNTVA